MILLWAWLTVSLSGAQEDFLVSVPRGLISAWVGSSVSLPCGLSPPVNAAPLEVRWYRSGSFNNPVLLYMEQRIQEAPVDSRYPGRVSLVGGLKRGNVSLGLENVTVADEGEYVCHVTGEQAYDKASVFLRVRAQGSEPRVSVQPMKADQVNVTCFSKGWFPQPALTWRDREGIEVNHPGHLLSTSDHRGLVTVSSWVLHSPSDSEWLVCAVSLAEGERRDTRVLLATSSPGYWKEAFFATLVLSLLVIIILTLLLILLYRKTGFAGFFQSKETKIADQVQQGESKILLKGPEKLNLSVQDESEEPPIAGRN